MAVLLQIWRFQYNMDDVIYDSLVQYQEDLCFWKRWLWKIKIEPKPWLATTILGKTPARVCHLICCFILDSSSYMKMIKVILLNVTWVYIWQSVLDEAAEKALLPSFDANIGDLTISGRFFFIIFCFVLSPDIFIEVFPIS